MITANFIAIVALANFHNFFPIFATRSWQTYCSLRWRGYLRTTNTCIQKTLYASVSTTFRAIYSTIRHHFVTNTRKTCTPTRAGQNYIIWSPVKLSTQFRVFREIKFFMFGLLDLVKDYPNAKERNVPSLESFASSASFSWELQTAFWNLSHLKANVYYQSCWFVIVLDVCLTSEEEIDF